MKPTKILLGARIKELRKGRSMSQEQLAEKIGIDQKHLSRIEVGRGYPSIDTLENLSNALDVSMKQFFCYGHLDSLEEVDIAINTWLQTASENDKRNVLKIINALSN